MISIGALRERLRTSLWMAPAVAAVVAVVLAKTLTGVDRRIGPDAAAWYLFGGGPESARQLLSTITASMITLTALVFSITVVVLQLASGQFSPRVQRTFLQERSTKVAMAVFVGTFVYSMLLLAEVRAGPSAFVPALAVWVAVLFVLVSVGVFITYIDSMARSVRAVSVLARVALDARRSIHDMYPEEVAEGAAPPEEPRLPARAPDAVLLHVGSPGVLVEVGGEELLEAAVQSDCVVELVARVGDFLPHGVPLFRVWGGAGVDPERLRAAVSLGRERTPLQDPAFGLRQLVDVAVRALSPGLNDPSTAVHAIDQVHDLLRRLTRRRFPASVRADASGEVRLRLPAPSYEDYLRLGFEEILGYGRDSIQVVRRLRAMLEDLRAVAPDSRRPALETWHRRVDEAERRLGIAREES